MLTRRMFLASAGSAALLLHPALAAAPATAKAVPDVKNPAIDVLADVVRDFLEHIDSFGGPEKHRSFGLSEMYYEWSDIKGPELEAKIIKTMEEIYAHPLCAEIKAKHGSIIDDDGRMRIQAQFLFPEYFPMNLQYAGTTSVFGAFLSFAPKHLL